MEETLNALGARIVRFPDHEERPAPTVEVGAAGLLRRPPEEVFAG
jgi:hypothetical protein